MISPVSVESLQRKYIKVRFLRDFERDCSGVGGFYYTRVTPPVSREKKEKKKKKKKKKILSANTDLELRDKSEY